MKAEEAYPILLSLLASDHKRYIDQYNTMDISYEIHDPPGYTRPDDDPYRSI